uniref:Uncharacterized protein n=1 Tax=Knipowitschia caucasica TaxID=637954 RepID=A0AAV2KQJ9_KNICA
MELSESSFMSGSSGEEYIPPAASSSRRSAPKRKRASTSQGRGGGWGQGPSHAGVAAVNLTVAPRKENGHLPLKAVEGVGGKARGMLDTLL